jgi:hypothetical protein
MALAAAETHESGAVRAALNYIVDTGTKPVAESYGPGIGLQRRNTATVDARVVEIQDARPLRDSFSLETSGFVLTAHRTAMRDFLDPDEIEAVYYPEMERLIAEQSGAARVHIFDHTLRTSDKEAQEARQIREPVRAVHNDYTEWSGPQRVRDFYAAKAGALLKNRFAIIQVWRAIGAPVERDPLAIADVRSLEAQDFIAAERRFPDRVGEIYQFRYNPAHRWYYFPRMRRDEALVFKVYDSDHGGRARWGAHSAFENPSTPPSAPMRESIEIRAFAFFES